jgi:hypothetical protein
MAEPDDAGEGGARRAGPGAGAEPGPGAAEGPASASMVGMEGGGEHRLAVCPNAGSRSYRGVESLPDGAMESGGEFMIGSAGASSGV